MISLVVAYTLSVAVVLGSLALAMKRDGRRVRWLDLAIIAVLCCTIAPLPTAGWALATLVMGLLLTKVQNMDLWPDTVVLLMASNLVWMVAFGTL